MQSGRECGVSFTRVSGKVLPPRTCRSYHSHGAIKPPKIPPRGMTSVDTILETVVVFARVAIVVYFIVARTRRQ